MKQKSSFFQKSNLTTFFILIPGKLLKGPTEQQPSKITSPQSNKVIKTQKKVKIAKEK